MQRLQFDAMNRALLESIRFGGDEKKVDELEQSGILNTPPVFDEVIELLDGGESVEGAMEYYDKRAVELGMPTVGQAREMFSLDREGRFHGRN